MTIASNHIVIYDLDGTLIPFNSFKRWLIFTTISALFFLGFGLLFAIAALVLAFWETHRELIFGSVAVIFLLIGCILLISLNNQRKLSSELFSASIDELKKDQQVIFQRNRE